MPRRSLTSQLFAVSPFRVRVEARRAAAQHIPRVRHSFGTQAIREFNIYEVQRMMGHRHITTTERYLHYAPDLEAAAKLSGLFGAPCPARTAEISFRCAEVGSLWGA